MMIMDALIIILKNTNTILAALRAIYNADCHHVGTGPLFQCCRNSMVETPFILCIKTRPHADFDHY